jgi:tetratricopeptide (TPR) repeat protein
MTAATLDSRDAFRQSVAAYKTGDFDEAERLCMEIIKCDARHGEATRLLTSVSQRLGHHAELLECCNRVLAARPADPQVLCLKAEALRGLGRFNEALVSCEEATRLRPDFAGAENGRGLTLLELRRFPEALASFARAQALAPDFAEAHWNEAWLRLLTGDFTRGWVKYGWRPRRDGATSPQPKFSQPAWDGLSSLYERTLLVHANGFLNDAIQFCRFVPQLAVPG